MKPMVVVVLAAVVLRWCQSSGSGAEACQPGGVMLPCRPCCHVRTAACVALLSRCLPAAALGQGWEVDAPTGLVLVKQGPAAQVEAATQKQLQRLAEYVVHLES